MSNPLKVLLAMMGLALVGIVSYASEEPRWQAVRPGQGEPRWQTVQRNAQGVPQSSGTTIDVSADRSDEQARADEQARKDQRERDEEIRNLRSLAFHVNGLYGRVAGTVRSLDQSYAISGIQSGNGAATGGGGFDQQQRPAASRPSAGQPPVRSEREMFDEITRVLKSLRVAPAPSRVTGGN